MHNPSRRDLIKAGIALASGVTASVLESPLCAGPLSNPALGGQNFKLGLVTYNLAKDWDIAAILKNCEETGFEAVELRTTHKHGVEPGLSKEQRREVKKQFEGRKVRLLSLGTTCEYHSPDLTAVRKNIEETKRFVELARDVGALGVKVRPNGIPKEVREEKTEDQIGKALQECGQAAGNFGVEIWLEVHGQDSNLPRRIHKMVEAADSPHVGICWNCNPEDLENGSIGKNFELLKPWLRSSHINELWNEKYPWRDLFALMKTAGYHRYTLAEIPETSDPIRLMHYYRALWRSLQI